EDGDAAAAHAPADPFHFRGVAANLDLVAGFTLDVEEVVDAVLTLAQQNRQRANRLVREIREHVRRQRLGFERNGGLVFEGQGNHQAGLTTSAWRMRSISTG